MSCLFSILHYTAIQSLSVYLHPLQWIATYIAELPTIIHSFYWPGKYMYVTNAVYGWWVAMKWQVTAKSKTKWPQLRCPCEKNLAM